MTNAEAPHMENKALSEGFAQIAALFASSGADPHAVYQRHLEEAPVVAGDVCAELGSSSMAGQTGRPIFTVFRHEDVLRVLRDPKTFTSGILLETGIGPFLDGLMITGLDGEDHRRLRGILQPSFTPAVMEDWRADMIRPLIRSNFVEPLAPLGKAELVSRMGVMFPIHVVYAVLGFQDDPAALEHFGALALKILGGIANDPAAKAAAFQAFKDLYDPTRAAVEARRREGAPGSDLMSRLIRAEFEGRSLDDHQITNFVRMMLPAASETTSRTFANLVYLLLREPDVMAAVKADRSRLRSALDESARLEPVATFKVRETQKDLVLQNVSIPKGSVISACVAAANRDPRVFKDPDRFDLDRKQLPSFAFGFGPHTCLGLHLAKVEIEEAVDLILDHMPNLRVDPDHPHPEIKGVHLRGPEALHVVWDPL